MVPTGGPHVREGSNRLSRRHRGPPVTREEFGVVVDACHLPYSLAWTEATYEACLGGGAGVGARGGGISGEGELDGTKEKRRKKMRTRVEFWATFRAALEATREECDDILCG